MTPSFPYQTLSLTEFMRLYATEAACQDALISHRWPSGFQCPHCGHGACSRLRTRRAVQCRQRSCRKQISLTAGTTFEHLKLPLATIFTALYLMTDKQGISAMALMKHLRIAYATAFNLLHRLRAAMAERDLCYRLRGTIQVDEAYLGGHGDGRHRSGRARDSKAVVVALVEQRGPNLTGFIQREVAPAADAPSLQGLVVERVEQGATIRTDAWPAYHGLSEKGFIHDAEKSPGGAAACTTWPLVHRCFGNVAKWLLGTHRQFCQRHLPLYLAEFCWRTNRRNRTAKERALNSREVMLSRNSGVMVK